MATLTRPRLWSPPAATAVPQARLAELRALLADAAVRWPRPVLATSLQVEDSLLTALIAGDGLAIDVVAIDTGRLHAETDALIDATAQTLGVAVTRIGPSAPAVARLVARWGVDGFYEAPAARIACCGARKTEPLRAALAGRTAWITGQRREQSTGRGQVVTVEADEVFGLTKLNPLADWSTEEVWAAARALGAPIHPLYARGYASIGCEPCTRPVRADEHPRAGRWWWESDGRQECGLHAPDQGHSADGVADAHEQEIRA